VAVVLGHLLERLTPPLNLSVCDPHDVFMRWFGAVTNPLLQLIEPLLELGWVVSTRWLLCTFLGVG
jgi:hypothetical protein